MSKKDSIGKTLLVAISLCVICSILVSASTIFLRPYQEENKLLDLKKNLLLSSGLLKDGKADREEILKAYQLIKPVVVNLESGLIETSMNPDEFDERSAAKDATLNRMIDADKDLAKIKQRSRYAKVYLVVQDNSILQIVLPVYGKGLWSTMYGFLALDADTKTVKGFGFYEHGETPGLGGEIDNAKWKKSWIGKIVYNDVFTPIIDIIKGQVDVNSSDASHEIDGISGATITSRGVGNLLRYWLGDDGHARFLKNFREGRIHL